MVACPGGELAVGRQVATMMGGTGRTFDGGYAEYTCVPVRQTVPFDLTSPTRTWKPEGQPASSWSFPEGLDTLHGERETTP